jgi:TPR repeat protein
MDTPNLLLEIERLRDGSRPDEKEAYRLAEKHRDDDEYCRVQYYSFLLFSPVEGSAALTFLLLYMHIPFVAARVGYFLIHSGDIAQGLPHLQKAADAGHKFAQHALACMLHQGDKISRDVPRAVEMLEKLAASNFLPSVYALGVHHYKPPSEAKGDETGLNLIREAAKAGYKTAIEVLQDLERRATMFSVAVTSY